MSNAESHSSRGQSIDPDSLQALHSAIRNVLESERNALAGKIRSYPPPIPACDAYFNYLLEERAKVAHELTRLDEVCGANSAGECSVDQIDEFVRCCAYMDDATRCEMRARLRESYK